MTLSGKQVLVTGAGGFIGSHLCEALIESGAKVRAFVHYNARGSAGWLEESEHLADIEVFPGDIADARRVHEAVRGCETVFHLAALIGIPYSYHAPASYVSTNINGTLNVLDACRDERTPRVVHTSTSEVYGSARYTPIDEQHPLCGQSPYSATKIAADKLAESYHCSFDLPVVTVRPFNTYGPRQSPRAVIPTIIQQLLSGSKAICLGSLHPTRDFNYVTDTSRGFIAAAEAPSEAACGRTFNLGSGTEISIGELVTLLKDITGSAAEVLTEDSRLRPAKSEVDRLLASAEAAREFLAHTPEVPLREGLERTVAWFRDHRGDPRRAGYAI